ncbi:hypothetical protein [Actinoplanes sp. NPDC049802]|uniref:hypothetical protein n=1 Tax=Actinoplanes sp. NPDC049802 TaxID=3154742 RepID=UPI0033F391FB
MDDEAGPGMKFTVTRTQNGLQLASTWQSDGIGLPAVLPLGTKHVLTADLTTVDAHGLLAFTEQHSQAPLLGSETAFSAAGRYTITALAGDSVFTTEITHLRICVDIPERSHRHHPGEFLIGATPAEPFPRTIRVGPTAADVKTDFNDYVSLGVAFTDGPFAGILRTALAGEHEQVWSMRWQGLPKR